MYTYSVNNMPTLIHKNLQVKVLAYKRQKEHTLANVCKYVMHTSIDIYIHICIYKNTYKFKCVNVLYMHFLGYLQEDFASSHDPG